MIRHKLTRRSVAFGVAAALLLPAGARAAGGGGGHAPPKGSTMDGPFMMRPPQILATKFIDGGIIHIGVQVSIKIIEKSDYDKAREVEPRVVDAFVRELNVIASGPWVSEKGVDHDVVKRRFLAAAIRILGKQIPADVVVEKSYRRRAS